VEPSRAFEIIAASIHDGDETVRSSACQGLAYLGTHSTIAPLLGVFHDEPNAVIREAAACGLAQSGMLSEKQRRTEVPKLLDFAEDSSLDPQTREWVFQALRDITGWTLPHDAAVWRNWYNHHPDGWRPVTHDEQ
jgi:HEAT repeat protein